MLAKLIEPRKALDPERQSFSNTMLRAMIIPLLIEQLLQMIVGIALAMGLDWCIKAALDIFRWKSGKWTEHKVI